MKQFTRITATASAGLATAVVATSVVLTNPLDDQPTEKASLTSRATSTRVTPDYYVNKKVDALLDRMTVKEKLQQVQLLSDGQVTDADAKKGVGGVFSL